MKTYLSAFITSAVLLTAANASADILCQRKSSSRRKPIQAIKVFEGTKCPKGHKLITTLLDKSDIETLAKSIITASTSVGPQGVQGEKGDQGIQGEKGEKGDKGDQGDQGIQGEKGDQGIQGEKGDQGIQGLQGEKGDKGDKGDQGIQGIQGEKGDKGDKGDQGIQGIQGEKGDKGDQGEKGDTGTPGAPGLDGAPGLNGKDGIINFENCYPTTLSRTGSQEETQTVFCNDPANEVVMHAGFSTDSDSARLTREILEFSYDSTTYTHPVGATIRTAGPFFNYTLSVTIYCCPLK